MKMGRLLGMKRYFLIAISFLGMGLSVPPLASARELQGRLGLGYNAQFIDPSTSGLRVPGISIKLGISRGLGVEFVEGIITSSSVTNVTGLKAFQNIFFEQYLNFYFMVGAAITTVKGNSGFAALTGFGSEFFIPGLESLGLSVETGIAYDNSGGSYALRTMGISFLDAGIHFYF